MSDVTKDFDELRRIYAADVDEEDRAENLQQIETWERALFKNEALLSWKEHDITKEIAQQAKESYRAHAMLLWQNRELSDAQRASLWAKQDAMTWILTLTEADPKAEIERIHAQIKTAISAA